MPQLVHTNLCRHLLAAAILQLNAKGRPMAKIRKKFLLSMQAEISPATYLVISVCSFAIFFVVWAVVVQAGLVRPIFLPSPVAIVTRLWALGVEGTLFSDIAASVYRIGVGFLVASISALAVGVLIGNYRFWNAAIEPFLDFIRYMPVVAFVPLTILWAGTTDTQKFLVIWIGTFFQQALMFMDNIKRVPPDFIGFGRTVGLSDAKIVTRIILPSAAPQFGTRYVSHSAGPGLGWCSLSSSRQAAALAIASTSPSVIFKPTQPSDTSSYSASSV